MSISIERGLCLIGCGFMGQALLDGWVKTGVAPSQVYVSDPSPSEWLHAIPGINLNSDFPENPDIIVVAVKPQLLDDILPELARFESAKTTFVSIAAGGPISLFETHLGINAAIIRAMPNLPASVSKGVTALIANVAADQKQIELVTSLFEAVGSVVQLTNEEQLHAVTALSGSGPAYVFAMAEVIAGAGTNLGLPPDLARTLAERTIAGASAMLAVPGADAESLRHAVTSKGGTTAAGLAQLLATPDGLSDLVQATLNAAHKRSVELSDSDVVG